MGYNDDDFILVWGSSRPGEEKLLEKIYPNLKAKIPNLKIIIAPRHLTRLTEIKTLLAKHNLSFYSEMKRSDIMIIDEMGILILFYCIADLSVVGGSFYDFGGHNPLEPAFYGSPVIIGKFHSSCRGSVVKLLTNNAIIVSNRKRLEEDILDLHKNPKKREEIGREARKTVIENSDSLEKNISRLEGCFNE